MTHFNAVSYLTDGTAKKVLNAHYVKNHAVDVDRIEEYLTKLHNLNKLQDLVNNDREVKNLLMEESSTIISPIINEMSTYSDDQMPLISKIIHNNKPREIK